MYSSNVGDSQNVQSLTVAPDSTFGMTASAGSGASADGAADSLGAADGSVLGASEAASLGALDGALLGAVDVVEPPQAATARTAARPRAINRLSILMCVSPPRGSDPVVTGW